jgi:hypothetical protein
MRFVEDADFRKGFFDGFEEPPVAIVNYYIFVLKDPNESFLPYIAGMDVENHLQNVVYINYVQTVLFLHKLNIPLIALLYPQVIKTQTKNYRLL